MMNGSHAAARGRNLAIVKYLRVQHYGYLVRTVAISGGRRFPSIGSQWRASPFFGSTAGGETFRLPHGLPWAAPTDWFDD